MSQIPADHPGLIHPGRQGDTRYLCPFCRWFYDESRWDGSPMAVPVAIPPPPPWPSPMDHVQAWVSAMLVQRAKETEAILVAHLRSHADEMTEG